MKKNTLKELFSEVTIKANSIFEVPKERLFEILNKYSFAVIRGIIEEDKIKKSKIKLTEIFCSDNDAPSTGESPQDIMGNFQKLSIGGWERFGKSRPRCMRTFYNPIWAEDIYELREVFIKTAMLRNLIYGFRKDFAIKNVEDGFWTASRIHCYPAGGGFLSSHKDNVVSTLQKQSGIGRYFQPVIVMSKKGTSKDCDFVSGGGFFEINKERYFYEEEAELGDIIIYSGKIIHGVADIDIHKKFDSTKNIGRLAGFVTLFKEFNNTQEFQKFIKKK